jgi:oligopeptide/dipeptide ABC transporter ATP-binding protein
VPLLSVKDLSVAITRGADSFPAVDAVSFDIEPGETVCIAGESGCGKSLTALGIMGLLPEAARVTGGQAILGGEDLLSLPQAEMRRVRGERAAMIFQEPMTSLNPLMKIGRQVTEPLFLHGRRDARENRRAGLQAMAAAGLPEPEKLWSMYPHQLSGGMRQRVMIAMAFITRPKLLIADEPTTALDAVSEGQVLRLLGELSGDTGMSVLYISHDLGLIRRLRGRVLIMYAGRFVEEGPAESVLTHPAHEYTKGLLGAVPTKDGKGKPLANIPGKVPAVTDAKAACPFMPRCPSRGKICAEMPPPRVAAGKRGVWCHFPDAEGVRGL